MHIPISETSTLEIVPFEEALTKSLAPSPYYDTNQWLYVPNQYGEYRYILGTKGKKPLICIGINPSTASPFELDNTLRSVERIAHHNGYDSFIMFNVYAQRATRPDDMDQECNQFLHQENMKAFNYVLSLSESNNPSIWAAWGTVIEKRSYLSSCVKDMIDIGKRHHATWFSAGKKSAAGHPHHPLYLKKDSTLDIFDVESYMRFLWR